MFFSPFGDHSWSALGNECQWRHLLWVFMHRQWTRMDNSNISRTWKSWWKKMDRTITLMGSKNGQTYGFNVKKQKPLLWPQQFWTPSLLHWVELILQGGAFSDGNRVRLSRQLFPHLWYRLVTVWEVTRRFFHIFLFFSTKSWRRFLTCMRLHGSCKQA